jgi:D-serine deaminase-like pyridoxal phosphate-dependent protein
VRGRVATAGGLAGMALALSACGSTNTYWYCWDSGAKGPHHFGHYVSGDHVCSDDELKGTGFKPQQ